MNTSHLQTQGPTTYRQAKPLHGLLMLVLAGVLMAAAPLSLVAVLMVGRQASASKSWPSVPGQVMSSGVRQINVATTEKYKAEVRYIYTVNGKPYTGTRIRFMDTTGTAEHRQRKLIEPYPQGSQTTVFYDPADLPQAS